MLALIVLANKTMRYRNMPLVCEEEEDAEEFEDDEEPGWNGHPPKAEEEAEEEEEAEFPEDFQRRDGSEFEEPEEDFLRIAA